MRRILLIGLAVVGGLVGLFVLTLAVGEVRRWAPLVMGQSVHIVVAVDGAAALDRPTADVLQRRLEEAQPFGVTVTDIGAHRLSIVVAGNPDRAALGAVLTAPGKLSLQPVDEAAADRGRTTTPLGDVLLPLAGGKEAPLPVERRVVVPGDDIVSARQEFDQQDGSPDIVIQLNEAGRKDFARATGKMLGKRLAIVLDGKVLTAPVINEPILGGSLLISGSFSVASAQQLASLLQGGALPAPIRVISIDAPH